MEELKIIDLRKTCLKNKTISKYNFAIYKAKGEEFHLVKLTNNL